MYLLVQLQRLLDSTRVFDFLGPLALRLYLVPIFWMAGTKKLADMDNVIAWFGNPDWGLGLPFPEFMAWAAALTEAGGAILLLIGGFDLYDALNHAFTTLPTGGFSTKNASVAHFDSLYVDVVITVFMLLAGMNFALHFIAWRSMSLRSYLRDTELKAYLWVLAVVTGWTLTLAGGALACAVVGGLAFGAFARRRHR